MAQEGFLPPPPVPPFDRVTRVIDGDNAQSALSSGKT